MRRRTALELTATVAILLGVFCSLGAAGEDRFSHQPASQHFKFANESAGRSGRTGTTDVDFQNWRSEDGIRVRDTAEHYRSADDAEARLRSLVASARRILQDPERSSGGKQSVHRVRLVRKSGDDRATVAWVDRTVVHVLYSRSWAHLLDFEEQFYPSSR